MLWYIKKRRYVKSGELRVESGGRLDKVLSQALSESRSQIAKLIESGFVEVDGVVVEKSSYKILEGQRVSYTFVEAERRESTPVDFDMKILYEDDELLVLDKPAGVVVHPAPSVKEATVVDWLVARGISLSTIAGEERYGIVHRIDKVTSGALLVAKNNDAHRELSSQLQNKSMGRYYLALIDYPLKDNLTIERSIGRNPSNRLKMAVVPDGRYAKTDFARIAQSRTGTTELVAARLHTGRTHQIRVHLSSVGRHIIGDELYGYRDSPKMKERIFLHAFRLYFTHPASGKRIEIKAPLPEDMKSYMIKNYDRSETDEKWIEKRLDDLFGSAGFTDSDRLCRS